MRIRRDPQPGAVGGDTRRGADRTAAREGGWAEIVILLLSAAVIGMAFVWALVLRDKPPDATTGARRIPRITSHS